jgi:protein-tyrosine phosphatase
MKRVKIWICLALVSIILCTGGFSFISKPQCKKPGDSYLVLDSDKVKGLPDRFRNDTALNISGSAQFTPPQLANIINEINTQDITIVDLRQETHGFVNDYAVRLFSRTTIINKNCTSNQVLEAGRKYFGAIQPGDKVNIYSRRKVLKDTLTAVRALTEEELVKEKNIRYALFAVQDGSIPTPQVVDDFVGFVVSKPEGSHLHFHCLAGEGRTTTFMVMYQIMMNDNNLSLEEIMQYQESIGGVNLFLRPLRAEFLEDFYTYVKENKAGGYQVKYSEWEKDRQ